jgi:hypothetical protein
LLALRQAQGKRCITRATGKSPDTESLILSLSNDEPSWSWHDKLTSERVKAISDS